MLSQQRVLDRLGRPGLAVDDAALWADEPDSRLESVNELGDICYVLFTSGSTGKPKGVTLTHFSVMNTLRNANEQHGVGPGDRSLQLSDFAFDLSVYDIFGMLAAGAGVVIPDEARHLEPPHWVEIARQHKATIWLSVPMYADMWVQSGEALPSMRVFMMGGDKIPTDLPDRMRPLAPGAAIWSVGGPTETSIISNWYPIGEVDPIWTTIPYGRAMLNQKMFVLDHGLNQCPPFMPGRIFMGGVCLARGYWKDQEKTDAAFVTYPATGERIYYTGDLGRWLPDGQVEFLGRADFQVKINGFRIELGEIEGAIQALPGVKAALVDGQEQPNGKGKFLVAYVVSEEALDAAQMRAALQDRLPYYMIPRVFVPLGAHPALGQRQGRSQGAASAGCRANARRAALRRAAHRDRGDAGGHLAGGAEARADRHPRQLLCAWRRLAAVRANRHQGAGGRAADRSHCVESHPHHRGAGARPGAGARSAGGRGNGRREVVAHAALLLLLGDRAAAAVQRLGGVPLLAGA